MRTWKDAGEKILILSVGLPAFQELIHCPSQVEGVSENTGLRVDEQLRVCTE
jgi:hypothetical protein